MYEYLPRSFRLEAVFASEVKHSEGGLRLLQLAVEGEKRLEDDERLGGL